MVLYQTSKAALNKPDFDTDNTAEAGFVDVFNRKLPTRIPGTVRLFDRKDYYSVHGEDALYVADNVYHTKTVLKYWKGRSALKSSVNGSTSANRFTHELPSCTLSKAVANAFLREALTTKQLRIEIWAPSTSQGTSASSFGGWQLDKSASPGNLDDVEDLIFSHDGLDDGEGDARDLMKESPVCMSVVVRIKSEGHSVGGATKMVGVAFLDPMDKKIGLAEFTDNDIFSNMESLLIQVGVKEVVLPAEDKATELEGKKLRKLIDRCGIVWTERKRADFSGKNIEQDLTNLVKGDQEFSTRAEYDHKIALSACSGLIAYLELLAGADASDGSRKNFTLFTHDLSQYMKLDASAVRALTLMPDSSVTSFGAPIPVNPACATIGTVKSGSAKGKNSSGSLFALLNKCKTSQGSRLLAMWLKQPLVNLHQITNRQTLVGAFVDRHEILDSLRDELLKQMPDFSRMSKRFQIGKANLDDVVRAYQAVSVLPEILNQLVELSGESDDTGMALDEQSDTIRALLVDTYIAKLRDDVESTAKLCELVETTIDLSQLDSHRVIIKPEYDPKLEELTDKLKQTTEELNDAYADTARDLGLATDSNPVKGKAKLHFDNHQVFGYCFRLTRKEASVLKGKKGYTELANRQNGCYFVTKALKALNEEYKDLIERYERKQSGLSREVVKIAASYAPLLEGINGTIAHLDVICSLAHVAMNAPISYVKPEMVERGSESLVLEDSRHPCLETLPEINFIPNDVTMKRGESEFQIITGANTGGKSVYLRQIGCIALMAQIGSFVPATSARLPIFDCILARVGAGDSQLKGISTFMAEMLETATILKSATKDSLILIDELGRGTSTYDGFGLAWAISDHIAKEIGCFTLFATHFHDLTTLADAPGITTVKNLHVQAHVEAKSDSITGRDIVMLYKVKEGVSDQSFGIHVAELAKFPQEVVRLAKRKADELQEDVAELDGEDGATGNRAKYTPDEVAEGTKLVDDLLQDWLVACQEAGTDLQLPGASQTSLNGEAGTTGEDEEAKRQRAEKEMAILEKCFEQHRSKLEASRYFSDVVLQTY